jgi:hypothetical protein
VTRLTGLGDVLNIESKEGGCFGTVLLVSVLNNWKSGVYHERIDRGPNLSLVLNTLKFKVPLRSHIRGVYQCLCFYMVFYVCSIS